MIIVIYKIPFVGQLSKLLFFQFKHYMLLDRNSFDSIWQIVFKYRHTELFVLVNKGIMAHHTLYSAFVK